MSGLSQNTLYTFYVTTVHTTLDDDDENKVVESEASETVLEWTEPVVPAYAEVMSNRPRQFPDPTPYVQAPGFKISSKSSVSVPVIALLV